MRKLDFYHFCNLAIVKLNEDIKKNTISKITTEQTRISAMAANKHKKTKFLSFL